MFTKGQVLYTKGLDMRCKPVVCKVKFVEYKKSDENGFDCVIDVGFLMKAETKSLFAKKSDVVIA